VSTRTITTRPRALAALTATALATTALVAVGTAADAVPPVPSTIQVATGAEYEQALADVRNDDSQAHTIVLTADITLLNDAYTRYTGVQGLTIDGAGFTATGQVSDAATGGQGDATLLYVLPPDQQDPDIDYEPAISIEDITVENFTTNGAVISASIGTLTITDTTFRNNGFDFANNSDFFFPGSGAVTANGDVAISNSTFVENDGYFGGAVGISPFQNTTATLTITDSVFTGNAGQYGGGVFNVGGLDVTNSTFNDNAAATGAGIYGASRTSIVASDFSGNADTNVFNGGSDTSGGAVYALGSLEVIDSTFSDNSASSGGAIGFTADTPFADTDAVLALTVTGSTFAANSAELGGGAIDAAATHSGLDEDGGGIATVEVTNSTFTGNSAAGAEYGAGAIDVGQLRVSDLTLMQNTFADNTGTTASHVAGELADSGVATIFANAFVGEGELGCDIVAAGTQSLDNFDSDGSCTDGWSGDGDIGDGLDAMLGSLADNGGPTATMLPASGSPLIDGSSVIGGECALDTDQRGTARPQGDACDIGAVEVVPSVTPETPEIPAESTDPVAFTIKTATGSIAGLAYGATSVTNIVWTATSDITSAPPAGLVLPLGIAAFDLAVPTAGDSVRIELTLPMAVTEFWKVQNGTWSQVDGASVSGTSVSYELTDGEAGDEDGTANAVIVDPIAPAVSAAFTG